MRVIFKTRKDYWISKIMRIIKPCFCGYSSWNLNCIGCSMRIRFLCEKIQYRNDVEWSDV